jgi:hypothetical protein
VGPSADADAATIGLWDAAGAIRDPDLAPDLTADIKASGVTDTTADLPAGDTELDLGRAALEANDPDEAALRLGLVLRVAPFLAPAVLDLVDGRTEQGLALVRGDAYRLVGRELDARRAFIEAARGGSWPPPADPLTGPPADSTDPPSEGDPA